MTAEIDALRAEIDRIPCDGHWWVHRDDGGRRSVVWDAVPHMVWSAGDEEWCVAERERLNEDPRAATLLAALRGYVTLTSASGHTLDAARLAEMLAYVRTEPLQLGIANANADADKAYCLWQANNGKLVKALDAIGVAVEARQQAESTRDAAQAVATRAEERARAERERAERAEAERDEWRACAEEGARLIKAQHIDSAMAWADAIHINPSAGTGGHERAGEDGGMTPPYKPEPCPKCGETSECVDWCEVDTSIGLQTFDPEYRCPTHGVFAFKRAPLDALTGFPFAPSDPVFQDDGP